MGQYYFPVLLNDDRTLKQWFEPWAFENGAKLIEHSYVGNNFVEAVVAAIRDNPTKLVWLGDYSDNDILWDKCKKSEEKKAKVKKADVSGLRYFVNHDRREWFDLEKQKVPAFPSDEELSFHPLPILTADGNGNGGGDYCGDHMEYVGLWAYNSIEATTKRPDDRNYKEITPWFSEL